MERIGDTNRDTLLRHPVFSYNILLGTINDRRLVVIAGAGMEGINFLHLHILWRRPIKTKRKLMIETTSSSGLLSLEKN
jgi:hypothetical protein